MKKKKFWIIGGILAVIVIAIIVMANKKDTTKYDTEKVVPADLTQEVSVTGKVQPAKDVDLALERSGRVSSVQARIGDRVVAGKVLVTLDSADLAASVNQASASLDAARAQLAQYQAALANQQAKLDELQKGARAEDVALKQGDVNKAQQDLDNYYLQVITTLSDAYTKVDDSVRSKTSTIFTGSSNEAYSLTFNSCDGGAEADVTWKRGISERDLQLWINQLKALTSVTNHLQLDEALLAGQKHVATSKEFLDALSRLLTLPCSLSDSNLDTYRTNVNTALTSINTAQSSVNALQQALSSQHIVVSRAQDDLSKTLAGSTPEQISAQRAAVQQAQAYVLSQEAQIKGAEASKQNYQAQLAKNIIRAPFDGLITRQDAKVGQIAQGGVALVSVISDKKYQVEANVPEADITKLKIADTATITLDAYGSEIEFQATVVAIDPAETVIDGVSTYKTTFEFTQDDERIKSGMTANITVLTATRSNVLAVSQRAVTTKDGQKIVHILELVDSKPTVKDVVITTGLVGSDGKIEVLSGLNQGDNVITSQIK
jgi:HlyD family secretion protein